MKLPTQMLTVNAKMKGELFGCLLNVPVEFTILNTLLNANYLYSNQIAAYSDIHMIAILYHQLIKKHQPTEY